MERESFEDEATAELLNRSFVSIKVDREERPDVDKVYVSFASHHYCLTKHLLCTRCCVVSPCTGDPWLPACCLLLLQFVLLC